jgi:MFS transporter, DHA1 family, tetracycline resistance protein
MTHNTHPLRISRQLVLILITVFLNIMGLGLILPVLPFYATAYGANSAQVGLLFTAFSLLQFLASPIFGTLSDRLGRRPIILFGILGQTAAYLMMGLANSLGVLFLSRVFAGATAGNISATQAYVADVTRPEERTAAYGLVGAAFGAGLLFGPALGGALSLIDSRAPAFGAAALLALNFLFGFLMLSESLPPERRAAKPLSQSLNPVGVLLPLVRRPPLRAPLLATFLFNLALTGFQATIAVFAGARFGLGPAEVSALFVATGLANILVQLLLVPRLSARFSDSALVLTGAAADAIGNLGTALAPVASVLWVSLPTMTGGYSLARGPLTSMVSKLVAPYEQGLANGGVQATISLAGVVGPLLAGVAYQYLGAPAPYWGSFLVVAVAALGIVLRTRPVPAPAVQPASPAASGPSVWRQP